VVGALLLASAAPLLAATPSSARTQQTSMQPAQAQVPATRPRRMRIHVKNIKGRHFMPATVTSVDHGSGIVKMDSLGMALVVHFPPPTIKDLKAGDKISLLLGYRMQDR
jgi:hypothetical protein